MIFIYGRTAFPRTAGDYVLTPYVKSASAVGFLEQASTAAYSPDHGFTTNRAYRCFRRLGHKRNEGRKGKTLRNHRGPYVWHWA